MKLLSLIPLFILGISLHSEAQSLSTIPSDSIIQNGYAYSVHQSFFTRRYSIIKIANPEADFLMNRGFVGYCQREEEKYGWVLTSPDKKISPVYIVGSIRLEGKKHYCTSVVGIDPSESDTFLSHGMGGGGRFTASGLIADSELDQFYISTNNSVSAGLLKVGRAVKITGKHSWIPEKNVQMMGRIVLLSPHPTEPGKLDAFIELDDVVTLKNNGRSNSPITTAWHRKTFDLSLAEVALEYSYDEPIVFPINRGFSTWNGPALLNFNLQLIDLVNCRNAYVDFSKCRSL
jgi:hypothetical protein